METYGAFHVISIKTQAIIFTRRSDQARHCADVRESLIRPNAWVLLQFNGVDPTHPHSNKDSAGREYFQQPAFDSKVDTDPRHEVENVRIQLQGGNSGFVLDYEQVRQGQAK